jgi:uncharacterized protein (DUF362 family)
MTESRVALIRCHNYERENVAKAVTRLLKLLGGIEKFVKRGDKVLLKPNFIAPRSQRYATQTNPTIIAELARLLIDFGARPFIGDSPAWGNAYTCARALRLEESLKKLSIPVRQLNKPRSCQVGRKSTKIGLSSVALDADVIINLPKFKSHQQLVATFAIKNMFGCVSGKRKATWHFRRGKKTEDFCELLIDIYRFMNPAVTIIDAINVMDGQGPIRGRTRPLGWLIGGTDPIACEIVCCKLVNIQPENVPIIKTARRIGFGCSDMEKIQILGDEFSQYICTDFKLPKLIPVRFSFLHVCKSICKQVLLLAKSFKAKSKVHV